MQKPNIPIVKPVRHKEFKSKQSKYTHAPKLPMRAVIYGPSGSGKTVLLQSLILDIFRGAFVRWYIFSPSINVDHTWNPVKKYIEQEMGVDPQKEPFAFSEYDPEALDKIIRRQFKIAEYQKKKGQDVFQVGIIVDDMADEPKFTRQSKLLHQLYIRGRHAFITVITAVQKVTTLAPIIRTQATHIFTFRLRSMQDLETWLNENSAVYPKETLLALYNYCVQQPYGFLYQNLMVQDANEMFHFKFDGRLRVEEKPASKKTHDQVPSASTASRNPGQLRALGA